MVLYLFALRQAMAGWGMAAPAVFPGEAAIEKYHKCKEAMAGNAAREQKPF